ncbi:MAG: hypothetical protein H6718_10340 [Polyangiaceae bacterium]|nr:hypothetical protein [Myxococcales bacterium]MCB9585790.1 hypothetical protein [Polyangiaceae bacterium]MCB9607281.1 hypothetical protein [Polyangiaceae bacterium]
MSSWKKMKNLFWQSEGGEAPPPEINPEEMSDEDFAAFLQADEFSVTDQPVVQVGSVQVTTGANGVEIDFQDQYDEAGIPDTDEVEQLEKFLSGLDSSLPQTSRLAAAQAFLGAIGKSKDDVLRDAERKIRTVHGILQAKEHEAHGAVQTIQGEIDQLNAQIEERRQRIQAMQAELEGVRHCCRVEEGRLQAARVFFGHVQAPVQG